ncbi:hypothetical protein D9M70_630650 [compost metagenome]
MLTLATGIGTGIDGKTITMAPRSGNGTSLLWTNSTNITGNDIASAAITKNNPPSGS